MAIEAHRLIRWEGVLGSTATPIEQWSFSVKTDLSIFSLSQAARDTLAESLGEIYQVNIGDGFMGNDTVLTKVTIADVAAGGDWARDGSGGYIKGEWTGATPGLNVTPTRFPPQTAMCVSLVTPRAGAAGRGRFFLPAPGNQLGADRRLPADQTATIAGVCAEFLQDINSISDSARVQVYSTSGVHSPVTAVKVGRVLDTLRSRRESMAEGYQTAAVGS